MEATTITEPTTATVLRLAPCDKICGYSTCSTMVFPPRCGLCWFLAPFPSVSSRTATKGNIRGTDTPKGRKGNHQGKGVPLAAWLRFRSLCCGCWLVAFCEFRNNQGKAVALDRSNDHHRTTIRGTDTPRTQGNPSRQGRSHQWKQQLSVRAKTKTFRFPRCGSVPL